MKADLYDKINPDWVPSLKLGPHELATPKSSKKRYERTPSRKEKKIQFNAAYALSELQVAEIDTEETLLDVEKSDQSHCAFKWMTTLSNEIEPESDDQLEVKRLKLENASLKEKLYTGTGDICPETFKENYKGKHYTGLCYETLMALLTYLEPNITHTSRSSLTKFQKLVQVVYPKCFLT